MRGREVGMPALCSLLPAPALDNHRHASRQLHIPRRAAAYEHPEY